jgi:hypothetical protein
LDITEITMGAWAEGLLDNDVAQDFVLRWDRYIAPLIIERHWSGDMVWAFLRDLYFKNRFVPLEAPQNAELLALAALLARHKLPVPEDMKPVLERTLNAELGSSALREWSAAAARKKSLEALLKQIGGKKRRLTSSEAGDPTLEAEIARLEVFTGRFDRWIEAVSVPKADDDFDRQYPEFLNDLEKLLAAGIRRPLEGTDQEDQLVKLRLMLLAFYVGWKVRSTPAEMKNLIKKAEATKGYISMAPDAAE